MLICMACIIGEEYHVLSLCDRYSNWAIVCLWYVGLKRYQYALFICDFGIPGDTKERSFLGGVVVIVYNSYFSTLS